MTQRDEALRVLRLIARLNVGGPARHTIILDDGLRKRGFETLLIHGAVGPAEESLQGQAVERGIPTRYVARLGRAIRPWDDGLAFATILTVMWRWRPDVVHTHTAKAGTLGRLAALVFNLTRGRHRRCSVVHTFHGHVLSGYFGALGSALVRTVERILAKITDRIITISALQRSDIVRRFAIAPAEKVTVVPLGLELTPLLTRPLEWRGLRGDLGFGAAEFVVGYVGRLVPIKDLGTLIRAIAQARRELPQLRLVLAGDGEERRTLEALAGAQGLSADVRFVGWRTDLPSLYAALDLFALSSVNEGTPVSLIEAMAAGVPVIATSVGGVPDVVENGVTGVLIHAEDCDALAREIVRAATDTRARAVMAARARSLVATRYEAGRLVEEMDRLYRKETERKRRG